MTQNTRPFPKNWNNFAATPKTSIPRCFKECHVCEQPLKEGDVIVQVVGQRRGNTENVVPMASLPQLYHRECFERISVGAAKLVEEINNA